MWRLTKQYPWQLIRGSALGTVIGIQPGSGADMAAWMSYAMSKRFSKEPEKFGTGHPEGLIEAGASNNSSLAGAWIPALVFGIPGDSITAIAIGVLMMKNMAPGPTIFVNAPENVYALFLVFVIANLLMLPLGWAIIKIATRVLSVPRRVLMPIILVFAIVGSYAINNSLFDVGVMLAFGLLAFVLEENDFPVAPVILGVVLGPLLEEYFINSMIKSNGRLIGLVDRPIAAVLAAITIGIIGWTVIASMRAGKPDKETARS
jgi:TctA family transporter